MAAFTGTPASSGVYTSQTDGSHAAGTAVDAKVHIADSGLYTHTLGAGTGAVNMLILPPGKIKVLVDLCRVVSSAMVATADLHVGHRAHTNLDGTAVVEDDNSLHDNADAGSALDEALTLPAAGILEFDSQEGVTIFVTIDTANIEDTDTIRLFLAYTGSTP